MLSVICYSSLTPGLWRVAHVLSEGSKGGSKVSNAPLANNGKVAHSATQDPLYVYLVGL
jgi:hypothetical protein